MSEIMRELVIKNKSLDDSEKKSEDIDIKIDKNYADYIRKLNGVNDHKNISNGYILDEIVAFSTDDITDTFDKYESTLDEDLRSYGYDIEELNFIGSSDLGKDGSKDRMRVFIPVETEDYLDHHKSGQLEDCISKYEKSVFASRCERIEFKEVLLSVITDELYIDEISNAKFKDLIDSHDLFDISRVWYRGLDSDEIIRLAEEKTKQNVDERVNLIETVLQKDIDKILAIFETGNVYAYIENMVSKLEYTTVSELVNLMYNVSDTTVNKYVRKLDIDEHNVQKYLIDEYGINNLFKDFIAMRKDEDSISSFKMGRLVDQMLFDYLDENSSAKVKYSGDLYKVSFETKVSKTFTIEKLEC